jgi:phage-related baseplate assembly protein
MICMRIEVAAPRYISVSVRTRITVARGAAKSAVAAAVSVALTEFLDPRTGGPIGFGWPFGRDVYRSEILKVIQDVPGVDCVESLTLQADAGTPQCGDIRLCNTWLAASGTHRIEVMDAQ